MIEDRTRVVDGTRLVATWKGQSYAATAHTDEKGKIRVTVDGDPTEHTSLSRAGGSITDPTPCNGWNFWTIEGDPIPEKAPRAKAAPKAKTETTDEKPKRQPRAKKNADADDGSTPSAPAAPRPKTVKPNITKMRKQPQNGTVGYYCSACQNGFYVAEGEPAPNVCPEGHSKRLSAELESADILDVETTAEPETAEPEDILI